MIMKKYLILFITIASLSVFNSYAQESKINNADKSYSSFAYKDAVKSYERAADKGYKSEELYKKLGNSYYFNSDYEAAARWYGELFAMDSAVGSEYYYRYAQCLKSIGQWDKADKIMNEFNVFYKDDSRGKLYKEDADYLKQIKANSDRYTIADAGINSKYSDYGTIVYHNKIYFASARDTGNFSKRKHKWNDEFFTNLYEADLDSSGVKKIKSVLNSKFHESSPVFTKDGRTVYFTRNDYVNGKRGRDENKVTLVKIYKANFENNKWTNITSLPFNSDNYSTAHPALSADEKTLYFASNMPGTFGQSDLYKVSINGNGGYGSPQNLGKTINTEGKETFPYVTSENEIYFASDGHPGLGGLDVFVGKIEDNGIISNIQNLGFDINSPKDDFAYIIDPISRKGYFSSNKDGGQGSDDIYKFTETRKLKCVQNLEGIITDAENGTILPNTKVILYEKDQIKFTAVSDPTGFYSLPAACSKTYTIRAERRNYDKKELSVVIAALNGKTNVPIALNKSACQLIVGTDLAKCFGIKVIYFDLNKSDIVDQAALDLEKILTALNENPTMKLDIRSHTDSRGSYKYNESLSDRRAKSTMEWLIKKGVSAERLSAKGYGESKLINTCSDGVKCSEEEHQENRRSEFIITHI
jgi:outer membrane protein OmpA-like peptidoglycan-associated protein/tetratricopeptide (TPR) repeat protein